MASENIEIVRRGLDAYNRRDVEGVIATAHPEVEFVPLGSLLVGDSYGGHEGIRRFMAEIAEEWDEIVIKDDEFREEDDRVLLLGEFQARGKASGVEVRSPVAWIFDLRDGKVARMRAYSNQEEALRDVKQPS
jgi:ketosteroid isomerase-like protein